MRVSDVSAVEAGRSWVEGRFVMRSGFYAGRLPSTGDLNSKILEMFYQGILKDVGQEEASNFVRFVNNLKHLSAAAFIVAFNLFWNKKCKVTQIEQLLSDNEMLSGRGEELFSEGMALLGHLLGGVIKDEEGIIAASLPIKQEFISKHLKEIPEGERAQFRVTHIGHQYW